MTAHGGDDETVAPEDLPLPDSLLGPEISPVLKRREGDGAVDSLLMEESMALARDEEMAERHKKDLKAREKKLKMASGGTRKQVQ